MEKIKIVVAGIGGVGGYFGGLLAKQFQMHEKVEISFLARGEHLKAIQESGLRVIKGNSEFICNPRIATDNPMEIGTVDYAIISTKSYDLESVLLQLQPCINRENNSSYLSRHAINHRALHRNKSPKDFIGNFEWKFSVTPQWGNFHVLGKIQVESTKISAAELLEVSRISNFSANGKCAFNALSLIHIS